MIFLKITLNRGSVGRKGSKLKASLHSAAVFLRIFAQRL